jgi:hypothetical protein
MHNKNEFNKKLKDFIDSDKRMALVKDYINEYKLTTVLRALNNSDYTKGTIHTRSIGNLKQIVDNRIHPFIAIYKIFQFFVEFIFVVHNILSFPLVDCFHLFKSLSNTMCYKPHFTIIVASCVTQNEYGTRWLFQS